MVACHPSPTQYEPPPHALAANGEPRNVGIELEIRLDLETSLRVVQQCLGGHTRTESAIAGEVTGTRWGTVRVELDSRPLHERRYLRSLALFGVAPDSPAALAIEESVLMVARELVPMEITMPPIPWHELERLDPLWSALRAAGAEDTFASPFHAYGLHLNPEVPNLTVTTALDHLRGYLLLEPWLADAIEVDVARRVAPFIRRFPDRYGALVLDPAYRPDWDAFVTDYIEHNPTRNRPLDLLPLIAFATGRDLADAVRGWKLVKPRPAFHYRLPNCELNQAGWTPALDWNRWLAVERLAAAPELLGELTQAYADTLDAGGGERAWLAHLREHFAVGSGWSPAPSSPDPSTSLGMLARARRRRA